jgi:succinate-semialdehyde dehydrogenase / glutarate-semialdehyde dehydrogenase
MPIQSRNPATGEVSRTFDAASAQVIEATLVAAHQAFLSHRQTKMSERRAKMQRAAEILLRDKQRLAKLATLEMGKTLASAVAEVEKCAACCTHYADHAEAYLAPESLPSDAKKAEVRYLPLGPVLAVMPWNFPYWQVVRFAAPALMAGNVGILKHASNVPQCALALQAVFEEAGFAKGCFVTLLVGSEAIERVIADPRVVAVTLTGSEGAGASVASIAGKYLKKCVLELGGSDPFIVMPSADLDRAAKTAAQARTINNGQSCIAAKRFIVHEAVYEPFVAKFVDAMKALVVGDPMSATTAIGPLASTAQRDEVDAQVQDAVKHGAKVLCGGHQVSGPGAFYEPTVLADIPKSAKVYRDEVFGPVALLFQVKDISDAIALANDSSFGLGSSVWTQDPAEIERFALEIEAGQTFVNSIVASDPRLPFGGLKRSGYGRELSKHGIREFTNAKTVLIAKE